MRTLTSIINQDLILENCCRVLSPDELVYPLVNPGQEPEPILELSLDDWIGKITGEILQVICKSYQFIYLSINRDEGYTPEVIEMLAEHVSPKLIGINIINCHHFTWKSHVKPLLMPSSKIEIIDVSKNSWADDFALEQLSFKFSKSLKCLILENSKISNEVLTQLGKKCTALKSLTLQYCSQISDKGLIGIAPKVRLTHLRISHNQSITDKGVSELLLNSRQIILLSITNCANLTDDFMQRVCAPSDSKLKKNNLSTLSSLDLKALPSITVASIKSLSNAASNIREIDLRDCTSINIAQGMRELESLRSLRSLFLGPSYYALQSETFTASIIYHSQHLTTLHLDSLPDLKESDLCEILYESTNLNEVYFSDMSCGTNTIEAIVNSIPAIQRLSIVGSSKLQDKDVRCLTTVCLNLSSLNLSRCSQITSSAFSRSVIMKFLSELDLSGCGNIKDGQFLEYLNHLPIKKLVLDNMNLPFADMFLKASSAPLSHALKCLSLQRCPQLREKDVIVALNTFLKCENIDLTESSLPSSTLKTIQHFNPFLTFWSISGYVGFKMPPNNLSIFSQFFLRQNHLRKYYAARKFVQLYRRHKIYMEELRNQTRDNWALFKLSMLIKLQSSIRQYIAKKKTLRKLLAGRLIVKFCKRFLSRQRATKHRLAILHYKYQLRKKYFKGLFDFYVISKIELQRVFDQINMARSINIKEKIFAYFSGDLIQREERMFCQSAVVIWEENLCRNILSHWKMVLSPKFSISQHSKKLTQVFMNCLDFKYHNSFRQQHLLTVATRFRNRRLLTIAWMSFCHDLLRVHEISLLAPVAQTHYYSKFLFRVVRPVFHGMMAYWSYRRRKHEAMDKIDKRRNLKRLMKAMEDINYFHKTINQQNKSYNKAIYYCKSKAAKMLIEGSLLQIRDRRRKEVESLRLADRARSIVVAKRGLVYFWKNVQRVKYWKYHNEVADANSKRLLRVRTFNAWKIYLTIVDDIFDELCETMYRRYLLKWCGRIINSFKQNVMENKAFLQKLQSEILHIDNDKSMLAEAEKQDNREMFLRLISCIVSVQTMFRARYQQRKYHTYRIEALFSILTIQKCVRRYLALKRVKNIYRKRKVREQIREFNEIEKMHHEDLDSQYYEYLLKCLIKIQSCYRGMRGRRLAKSVAIVKARIKSKEQYQIISADRRAYEHYQRLAASRENARLKAIITIQRYQRGYIGRKALSKLRRGKKLRNAAIRIQTIFRGHLCRLRYLATIRDKAATIRFHKARRIRGLLLRTLGFSTRKSQHRIGKILSFIGIDPLSYHYKLSEIIQETADDFVKAFKNLATEIKLLQYFNSLDKREARNQLASAGKHNFSVGDAVKIIEPEHQFQGFTGQIIRIDEGLGLPIYEIKLDRFLFRQTFIRMTNDALQSYQQLQPVTHIPPRPKLKLPWRTHYHLKPEDPLFKKVNVKAALVIQRAFRRYRSSKVVARRRNEIWTKSAAIHNSMVAALGDTNSLTMLGFRTASLFPTRLRKSMAIDEVSHDLISPRFIQRLKGSNEAKQLLEEFQTKYKERVTFLQKSALIKADNFFFTGYEILNLSRNITLLATMTYGVIAKSCASTLNMFGSRSLSYLAKRKTAVTGVSRYAFPQFSGSPHVRYYKTSIYQGEWTGIPLFTPLTPHGEGLIVFLEAWGIARESKVLYVTIVSCRNLIVGDINGFSDPYCVLTCNGVTVKSAVKYRTLSPVFNQTFEIDVTNPAAVLGIKVYDKDIVGPDDFLGQISLPLSKYIDGAEHREVHALKGEDLFSEKNYDNGDIEIIVYWTERKFDDDLISLDNELKSSIRIQCWIRKVLAIIRRKRLYEGRRRFLQLVSKKATMITSVCRMRLAKKQLKFLQWRVRSAIKIQKRIRIFLAKILFARRLCYWRNAIILQKYVRRYLSIRLLQRKVLQYRLLKNECALRIQKNLRGYSAYVRVKTRFPEANIPRRGRRRKKLNAIAVAAWLQRNGYADVGARRTKRIIDFAFKKMLTMKYIRFLTRYGVAYLDQYPANIYGQDTLPESQVQVNPKDFVSFFLPAFRVLGCHRPEAIININRVTFNMLLHKGSILISRSVDYQATIIQCAYRVRIARKLRFRRRRHLYSIIKYQRLFRRYYSRIYKAANKIQSIFRMAHAMRIVRLLKTERKSAVIIQCSYRCHLAKLKVMNLRSIKSAVVLKYSSAVSGYGPEKCLEHRDHTFWSSDSPDFAEIRLELEKKECIKSIWIMTSTFSASPRFVSISAVLKKEDQQYETFIENRHMKLFNGPKWHIYHLPGVVSKFFRIAFYENYGDEKHISIRQIRLVRSHEVSARIDVEPQDIIRKEGPPVGQTQIEKLSLVASGWPSPSFQWYRNGDPIPGANKSDLELKIHCRQSSSCRTYRCLTCKMVTRKSPFNAYKVRCGNCLTEFTFKDTRDYEHALNNIFNSEFKCIDKKARNASNLLLIQKLQTANPNNPKYPQLIQTYNDNIAKLDIKLRKLKEDRYYLKLHGSMPMNRYNDEGIYHCVVSNVRGGSILVEKVSKRVIVVFENTMHFPLKVYPFYFPRHQLIRKRWATYQSILGTFNRGKLEGIVVIHYSDGSFYEGPYVGEEWLDNIGRVIPAGRSKTHYGVYKCPDGRVFEGSLVDNHFDMFNVQSFYKLTLANGEIYEGTFSDEHFHGHGIYYYNDGSVYEGQWHRGSQFGHGQYRSAEGWVYEGYFDDNRRHGEGCITWPDGSMYMGHWFYELIQGKGVFITKLRDVYKGEFNNGLFEGHGEIIYSDQSKYVGGFRENRRHGRGIFCDKDGSQYYGNFVADEKDGEFIVRIIVPIEEIGQQNFEIRIAIYDNGKFVRWKSKFSNESATKTFIRLFKENKEMFDSMYSMILARSLPNLPEGIDPKNKSVQDIIIKIRGEAGSLVGQDALIQAKAAVENLLVPISEKEIELQGLKDLFEASAHQIIALDNEIGEGERRFQEIMREAEKVSLQIEQKWLDDPHETRSKHKAAVAKLEAQSSDDWFKFKNQRIPPTFTVKIMNAVCFLLKLPNDWESQKLLLSDSVFNRASLAASEGVTVDKRYVYDCKLVNILQSYDVTNHLSEEKDRFEFDKILADTRFRSDSYYIESLGIVAPFLVDWVKANNSYVQTARSMLPLMQRLEKILAEAARFKAANMKRQEDLNHLLKQQESTKRLIYKQELDINDLREALIRANFMQKFVEDSFSYSQEQVSTVDYYKVLEEKLEKKKESFTIETCVQSMIDEICQRDQKEKLDANRNALATGKPIVEDEVKDLNIKQWIINEIQIQQQQLLKKGYHLGYSFEKEDNLITPELTMSTVSFIGKVVVLKLNNAWNEKSNASTWISLKGIKLSARFVYILTWKFWNEEIALHRNSNAIRDWENTFGSIENCARIAIESRFNSHFSKAAKQRSIVWAEAHVEEIKAMEIKLSDTFAEAYPLNAAAVALDISQDTSTTRTQSERASASCWIKYHSDLFDQIKDEQGEMMAEMFAREFSENTAEECFKILNGIANSTEMMWAQYADQWKAHNLDLYENTSNSIIDSMATEFRSTNDTLPYVEAAKLLENHAISKHIIDLDVAKDYETNSTDLFNATCYGMRYQGLFKKGKQIVREENKQNAEKLWRQLSDSTDGFVTGSSLYLSEEAKIDASLDAHYHFRKKLEFKNAWLYGYICKRHADLLFSMKQLAHKDPFRPTSVKHNLRPSQAEKSIRQIEKTYLSKKVSLENEMAEVMDKLTAWHTYFGWPSNLKDGIDATEGVDATEEDEFGEALQSERLRTLSEHSDENDADESVENKNDFQIDLTQE